MNYKLLFFSVFSFFILSCNKNNVDKTVISGNIPNLPDGTIYLYQDIYNNRIDSVRTKNGKFEINHQWKDNSEPAYLGIDHIDKNGVIRSFSFTTNAKYKGSGCNFQFFFSDSIVSIVGKMTEVKAKNIELEPKYKLVTSSKISAGMQTKALYNSDCDLFDNINVNSVKVIKEKILTYPYSYHLLYKIDDNKNSFSPQQTEDFLKSFKGDITKSETYKKLALYNEKRFNEKNIALPLLEDSNGKKSIILDPKYEKHFVVFWASWCGPCRQEIPTLKEIYSENNQSVEFISISVDSDKNAWKKALNEEQMSWKQFIVNEKDPEYEKLQIRFRLNGAIPFTVLVDNNMKILKSSLGLSSKEEIESMIK